MCKEIHSACCESQVCPTSQTIEKCLPQDNCVVHNIFSFEVEKHILCTSCDIKSRVEKYILWSHIGFASRLRVARGGFERNLATMYVVLLDYCMDDGRCEANNVETVELLKAQEILIISKFASFSRGA
jgi:hypothetical protein